MSLPLSSESVQKACCKVIACTGIGAAENDDCNGLLDKKVWVVVPESMHRDYSEKLLACAMKVCANDPYGWTVDKTAPEINDDTTFRQICELWLMKIV